MVNIYKIQVDNLSFIGLVANFFFTPHYFGSFEKSTNIDSLLRTFQKRFSVHRISNTQTPAGKDLKCYQFFHL